MIEVREVLRRWTAEQGVRRISRETGVDRKTVRRYVSAAEKAGYARGAEIDEGLVQEVVQRVQSRPLPTPSEQRQNLLPHTEQLRTWLMEDKPRRTKVHELLGRRGVEVT